MAFAPILLAFVSNAFRACASAPLQVLHEISAISLYALFGLLPSRKTSTEVVGCRFVSSIITARGDAQPAKNTDRSNAAMVTFFIVGCFVLLMSSMPN